LNIQIFSEANPAIHSKILPKIVFFNAQKRASVVAFFCQEKTTIFVQNAFHYYLG